MITPEQIAEWKDAAEKATPGPWFMHDFANPLVSRDPCAQDVTVSCASPDHIEVAHMSGGLYGYKGISQAQADAHFIALSREAVPALIAEVERLREALTEISTARFGAQSSCCDIRGLSKDDLWRLVDAVDETARKALEAQ